MSFVVHEGIRFHYTDEGTGLPMVFLHGLGGDLNQARELLEGLSELRLICFDFRGHGQTLAEITPNTASMETFCEDVLALVTQLELDAFILGGISLGAAISLAFCLRYPERVTKLVLIRPAWLNEPNAEHFAPLINIASCIEDRGTEDGLRLYQQSAEYQQIDASISGYARSLEGQFKRPQAGSAYQLLRHLPRHTPFNQWESLQSLAIPTLVLASEDDPLHPFCYGKKLAAKIPGADLRQVTSRYLDPGQHKKRALEHIADFVLRPEIGGR